MLPLYFLIGLLYWALNAFVRKLDTDDDWLLPLFWFFGWPLAAITWMVVLTQWLCEYSKRKFYKKQL